MKISKMTCLALSALITVLMGVAGCGLLKFVTAEAKTGNVNRPGAEVVGENTIETGLEPIDSPKVPSQTEQPPSSPEATPIIGDDESIRAALGTRLRVNGDALMVFVEENTGRHARGRVDNGYFMAAKVGKEWVIVADGQGVPDCDKASRYGFPTSMVPECESPAVPPAGPDEDAIRAALAVHFEMDENEFYHFEVNENTGMHAKGWSREEAIDYMASTKGAAAEGSGSEVVSEIERYVATPGQALGYMVGMLTILELREEAKNHLGDDFDIRAFHDAVLTKGGMPLPLLQAYVRARLGLAD